MALRAAVTSTPTRVLIVDDSAGARAMFKVIVESDPALQVMAAVPDAYAAARAMRTELPDAILLDLELPGMDGLTFLRKIMQQHPIPVIVCSSHVGAGTDTMVAALELGAKEVIAKPAARNEIERQEASIRICDAIRAATETTRRRAQPEARPLAPGPKLTADEILPARPPRPVPETMPVVCIGASTGGTEALRDVLTALPASAPPIVIVQHMPRGFTAAFARRLDSLCAIEVLEAEDEMQVLPGRAIIAQGDRHLLLRRRNQGYRVSVVDGAYVCRHRPSVDVLFRSAAQEAGSNALGIIMTGMGDDGARCMAEMRAADAETIAQNEESCVVYGMPREAVAHGGVQKVEPLDRLATRIVEFGRRQAERVAR
ncbi:chemotaxis response regulator protein-glutamate methylesterase [Cereibacter sphaeroides]|uniref:protein-glutamate methylesterase/protein-glutamine glutaminase n=1 Tax=Rhodobacterales TaxID=204455 RepID=UPI000BBF20D4|nr:MULTISPECIES: chemotaxis response regulator protein-glutamate methylesterase [Paracoccaceae]MCE6951808.1 chemotaxis response regulator protein-glutamate methylesterase [Cereibacter sphaeroides]